MTMKKILCFAALMILIPTTMTFAVDSSFGAHLTGEIAPTGTFQVHPGIDYRFIGGRGLVGSEFSVEYFPTNSRGYDSNNPSSLLMVSAYALAQLTMYYGDMAVYMGPGTSFYYGPNLGVDADSDGQNDGAGYSSLLNDSLIRWKTGFSYTIYPTQLFAEIDFDLRFVPFGVINPGLSVGFSFMR